MRREVGEKYPTRILSYRSLLAAWSLAKTALSRLLSLFSLMRSLAHRVSLYRVKLAGKAAKSVGLSVRGLFEH